MQMNEDKSSPSLSLSRTQVKVCHKEKSNKTTIKNISYDYLFKIALIGNSGVGKTSILLRFTENKYKENNQSTIGVDFKIITFSINDTSYTKMQIWDTCGSERFKSLTTSFIKSCPVFILVFDLTNRKSFLELDNWIKMINENSSPTLLNVVGNKADLKEQRQVELNEILQFSNQNSMNYFEVSAKEDLNIEELFIDINIRLYEEAIQLKEIKNTSSGFEIGGFKTVDTDLNKRTPIDDSSKSNTQNTGGNKCNC